VTHDRSLAKRIVGYLILTQLIAFHIGFAVRIAFELAQVAHFRLSLDEMATSRVSNLVIDSLVLNRGGAVSVKPNDGLRAEMQRTPLFKVAAFSDARAPLPGSSPELVSALTEARVIQITRVHVHFNLPGDQETTPLGYMERRWTPYGWFHIAVYRQKFRWVDFFDRLGDSFKWSVVTIFVVIFASTATAWYAVRKGLEPLRSAARQVDSIEIGSLAQGVHINDVPTEIRPFVDAIESALLKLAASAARMRRFTANAAHELRTPIAVMRARLENASASPLNSHLLEDSSQLQTLVEQMLITLRLTEDQALSNERIELEKVVQGIVSGLVLLALRCGRSLELDASSRSTIVRGNRRAIESIVANLIDNALRAEPVGGTVTVRVGDDGVVEIIDHGEGVAEGDRELIFEPFWRKSEATPGAGLGLAIAKELVEKLGGRIWVEDTPGGGATFKLWLPAATSETHANLNSERSSSRTNARS
jgi:signal transduction histidine kinase